MSVFEHVMTLGSFILALGLATILMFVATLVHRRNEVKLSLPHALWAGAIFINQINFWLGSYVFHGVDRTSYATIAFVIVFPILLYLQSALVVTETGAALDLPAHHARHRRAYISLVIAATALDALYFAAAGAGDPRFDPTLFLGADAILILSGLAAWWTDSRLVQIAAPAIHLAARTLGFFLASMPLLVG